MMVEKQQEACHASGQTELGSQGQREPSQSEETQGSEVVRNWDRGGEVGEEIKPESPSGQSY